jgi:hypothetical protein
MFVYIHILKHAYEFIWSMARYDAGSQSYMVTIIFVIFQSGLNYMGE